MDGHKEMPADHGNGHLEQLLRCELDATSAQQCAQNSDCEPVIAQGHHEQRDDLDCRGDGS